MPKETEKQTAEALIRAKDRGVARPSIHVIAELEKIFRHNDARPGSRVDRVGALAVVGLLASYGWTGGKASLDKLCRSLGRTSFAKP